MLEARKLCLAFSHPLELRDIQATVPGFPLVEMAGADAVLAPELADRDTGVSLFQD